MSCRLGEPAGPDHVSLQRRLFRRRRRHLRVLRRRKVQGDRRLRSVLELYGRDVLAKHRKHAARRLQSVWLGWPALQSVWRSPQATCKNVPCTLALHAGLRSAAGRGHRTATRTTAHAECPRQSPCPGCPEAFSLRCQGRAAPPTDINVSIVEGLRHLHF